MTSTTWVGSLPDIPIPGDSGVFYGNFDIAPIAKGRPRHTAGGNTYTPARTRQYEADLGLLLKLRLTALGLRQFTEERLGVVMEIRPRRSKGRADLDNYAKGVLDAANGILWGDDSQVDYLVCRAVAGQLPGVSLLVWSL